MNKKILKIIVPIATVLAIAGITVGISLKSNANDNETYYKTKIASNENFRINEKNLYYMEPNPDVFLLNPDYFLGRDIYRDDNEQYYYFDPDSHNIRTILNESPVREEGLTDKDSIIDDAKKRLSEWYEQDKYEITIDELEWVYETDDFYKDISVSVYQNVNEEISLCVASISYSGDGIFEGAWIHVDSIIKNKDLSRVISEKDAVEKASEFIEKEYGNIEWTNIGNRPLAGDNGNYWEITCQKKTFGGYVIAVDMLTGDARLEDVLK
ncbi:MAG: hypothetical protein HDT13_09765 [Butyrivibrio sp.]|nr:hypothetical protein [Butyrivibrio sp.]